MDLWRGSEQWETTQAELMAAGLTDGLPVVPPTPARVQAMLELRGVRGDEVIAELPPMFAPATWRDIAINCVMAGCRPEYLSVVAAIVEALAANEFNLLGIATTTGSVAPMTIVNGPIITEIGMNAAGNALGPGNAANATIGRAVTLVLRNIAGAKPGETDMATLGQPAKYGCSFAENEAESPWPPLHVDRGFTRESSVVTVVGAAGTVEVVDSCSNKPEDLAQTFAQSMLIAGTVGGARWLGSGQPLIIVPPELARVFHEGGYRKADVQQAVYERAVMPLERLSSAVREHLALGEDKSRPMKELRVAEHPSDVLIVVAGGVGAKAAYVPTWGGGTRAVSRLIAAR